LGGAKSPGSRNSNKGSSAAMTRGEEGERRWREERKTLSRQSPGSKNREGGRIVERSIGGRNTQSCVQESRNKKCDAAPRPAPGKEVPA